MTACEPLHSTRALQKMIDESYGFLWSHWYMLNTAGLPISYKFGPRWEDVITWPDFKSETNFGFLSPDYTGQPT